MEDKYSADIGCWSISTAPSDIHLARVPIYNWVLKEWSLSFAEGKEITCDNYTYAFHNWQTLRPWQFEEIRIFWDAFLRAALKVYNFIIIPKLVKNCDEKYGAVAFFNLMPTSGKTQLLIYDWKSVAKNRMEIQPDQVMHVCKGNLRTQPDMKTDWSKLERARSAFTYRNAFSFELLLARLRNKDKHARHYFSPKRERGRSLSRLTHFFLNEREGNEARQ